MRARRLLDFVSVLLPALALNAASGQSWTIGNARIERTLTYSATDGFRTSQLTNLDTGYSLIAASELPRSFAPEFALDCDGKKLAGVGRSFQLIGAATKAEPDGRSLTVSLRAADVPLTVDVVYRVYDGQPAIRKWLRLHNTGTAAVRISHLKVEAVSPSVGPSNETLLKAHYGETPRELLYTGRSEDAALLLSNARTGDGFAVVTEVPGYMKRTEVDGFYHPGHATISAMYDTDLMPFERELAAGETFQTAAVSLLVFRAGAGLLDPQWILPTYSHAVLQRRTGRAGAPWIYNTWTPFKRTINAKTSMELIDIAGSMGMDIFTIDDGWQKDYGENTVDTQAFPDGLDPIRAAAEAKGMRLGLWLPLAAIGKDTADYRNHPEWVALDHAGRPKETGTAAGTKGVMCLAGPYQDVAAKRVNDAIERFHLAYVKLDLTTVFNAYGESPGCWSKGLAYDDWVQSLGRIYEGIRNVTAQVYARHPDVLLDLTFELWGQKHLIDGGLLAAGDLDWLSNVDDSQNDSAGPRQARTLLYGRALSMPADAMLIGNLQAEVPNPAEVFATAIGSAPVLLGDLRKLSAGDRAWYREHIAWFKGLRSAASLGDSFFPLGSYEQPNAAQWDGFARISQTGTGVVTIFRNGSGLPSANVRLPLLPHGRYRLRSVMSHADLGTVTEQDWARGVPVKFAGAQNVEILDVRAIP